MLNNHQIRDYRVLVNFVLILVSTHYISLGSACSIIILDRKSILHAARKNASGGNIKHYFSMILYYVHNIIRYIIIRISIIRL